MNNKITVATFENSFLQNKLIKYYAEELAVPMLEHF